MSGRVLRLATPLVAVPVKQEKACCPGVPAALGCPPTRTSAPAPSACCSKLYMLLHETAPIVGLWRLVGEGPRGALIAFR